MICHISKNPFFIFLTFLLLFLPVLTINADPDVQITVNTEKETYGSGELVYIYGDLNRDGEPLVNSLVAIQIDNTQDDIVAIRTQSTGTTPSPWSITIIELTSCNRNGDPQDTFRKGTLAYLKVTVKNLDTLSERYVKITINLYDSNQVSFGIAWVGTTVGPNKEFTYLTSIPIPSEASTGAAFAFANAYNNWPKENGIAYCGEEAVSFTITDGAGSSGSDGSASSQSSGYEGTYELTFRLRSNPALGDYTVYASYYQALATTNFDVVWLFTDINRDGKVNVGDLFLIAKAFGSQPEDPKWNPKADVNDDNLINILDLFRVAKDFGKTRT